MKYSTKIHQSNTTFKTTIPIAIAKLLEIKNGDHLEWNLKITDKGEKKVSIKEVCSDE